MDAFWLAFGWNYTQILFGIPMSGTTLYNVLYTTFYSGELLSGGLYGFEGGILSILSRLLLLGILIYIFKFNLAKEDNGKATSTINSKTG